MSAGMSDLFVPSARRALAKLSRSTFGYGQGIGGAPVHSWEDVAGAVHKLARPIRDRGQIVRWVPDHLAQYLVLWLWAGQEDAYPRLESWLLAEISKLAAEGGWKRLKPGQLRKLVQIALAEEVNREACTTCAATGWVMDPRNPRQDINCRVCFGRGGFPWPARVRARHMQVNESTWRRVWAPRYGAVQNRVETIERHALSRIARVLSLPRDQL